MAISSSGRRCFPPESLLVGDLSGPEEIFANPKCLGPAAAEPLPVSGASSTRPTPTPHPRPVQCVSSSPGWPESPPSSWLSPAPPSAASLLPALPEAASLASQQHYVCVIQRQALTGARADTISPRGTASCSASAPVTGGERRSRFRRGLGGAGRVPPPGLLRGGQSRCSSTLAVRNGTHRQRDEGPWGSAQTWSC